jgi:hypothetical protein
MAPRNLTPQKVLTHYALSLSFSSWPATPCSLWSDYSVLIIHHLWGTPIAPQLPRSRRHSLMQAPSTYYEFVWQGTNGIVLELKSRNGSQRHNTLSLGSVIALKVILNRCRALLSDIVQLVMGMYTAMRRPRYWYAISNWKAKSKTIMERTQTAGRGMSVGPVARFISIFLSSKDRPSVRADTQ